MLIDPQSVLSSGGYAPVPAGVSVLDALRHALDPDEDYIVREEPDPAQLLLGYGSHSNVVQVSIYLRCYGEAPNGAELPLIVQLYDSASELKRWDTTMPLLGFSTLEFVHSFTARSFSDLRVGVRTSEIGMAVPRTEPGFSLISMCVVDVVQEGGGSGGTPPPLRVVRLYPAFGYHAAHYWLYVCTNLSDPLSVPAGFRFVGSPSGVRESGGELLLPDPNGKEHDYLILLRAI